LLVFATTADLNQTRIRQSCTTLPGVWLWGVHKLRLTT